MMWLILALAIGVGTGVLAAASRTPTNRMLPTFSALALGTGFILLLIFATDASTWLSYVYLAGLIIAQASYAAWIWSQVFPAVGLSFWELLGYEFIHPNRVRQQYAAMLTEREVSATAGRTTETSSTPNEQAASSQHP